MKRETVEFVHEGKYAAEVRVVLLENEMGWSPYLSAEDATKLDTVRQALKAGDIATAAKHGRVFNYSRHQLNPSVKIGTFRFGLPPSSVAPHPFASRDRDGYLL